MRNNERKSRAFAKELRGRMTDAELILWSRLRRNAVLGYRFRRQHPIGPFIADFACVREKLIVEVDGATHSSDDEREYDLRREAYLSKKGWRIQRILNDDIYKRLDEIVEFIALHLPPPPLLAAPPP